MIGLNTNILVRFLVQDEPLQLNKADHLIAGLSISQPGYISLIVLAELVWVLRNIYRVKKIDILRTLWALARVNNIVLEQAGAVLKAIHLFRTSGADFADCLIAVAGMRANCAYTSTFDRKAARLPGMRLLA